MTTFIRIEHPDSGWGIWRHQENMTVDNLSNFSEFNQRHSNFKTIGAELGNEPFNLSYYERQKYFCAFKSIKQLQQWVFQSEINEFITFGFRIYKIKANNCLIGEDQIFFKKENIISKIDITNIF